MKGAAGVSGNTPELRFAGWKSVDYALRLESTPSALFPTNQPMD
jgi:hypothetical protein